MLQAGGLGVHFGPLSVVKRTLVFSLKTVSVDMNSLFCRAYSRQVPNEEKNT